MPMDPTLNGSFSLVSSRQYHGLRDENLAIEGRPPSLPHQQRHCFGNSLPGESPLVALATDQSIIQHLFLEYGLDPQDLAALEASSQACILFLVTFLDTNIIMFLVSFVLQAMCTFFRQPVILSSYFNLSMPEATALDMCQKRAIFKSMKDEGKNILKQRCGGSWKLVLQFLKTSEKCSRCEKCQAISGPGHSIVVTKSGAVYSFGYNEFGQLGHGITEDELYPRLINMCF